MARKAARRGGRTAKAKAVADKAASRAAGERRPAAGLEVAARVAVRPCPEDARAEAATVASARAAAARGKAARGKAVTAAGSRAVLWR